MQALPGRPCAMELVDSCQYWRWVDRQIYELASSSTMHADRTKPVVPNKIPLRFTVRYMPIRLRVDVLFREPKVDHVDSLLLWR
jgi:hypothetical protein